MERVHPIWLGLHQSGRKWTQSAVLRLILLIEAVHVERGKTMRQVGRRIRQCESLTLVANRNDTDRFYEFATLSQILM
jgi:hypothetical protein